jgi:hypothetical protein
MHGGLHTMVTLECTGGGREKSFNLDVMKVV